MKRKGILKKIIVAAAVMLLIALAALSVYMTHSGEEDLGGFSDTREEKITQKLTETVWIEQQGEYLEVHLFCTNYDYWHGTMYEGKLRGTWGTFTIADEDSFSVVPYPDSYCDFEGIHRFSLKKNNITIDGVVYQKADYDEWVDKAYTADGIGQEGGF